MNVHNVLHKIISRWASRLHRMLFSRAIGKILLLLWIPLVNGQATAATATWRAESIAKSAGTNVRLRNASGEIAATLPTAQIRDLLEIKASLESVVGIRAELLIVEGSAPNASAGVRGDRYIITFNIPMLMMIGNDKDALAAIMGHEVAHLVRGHQQDRAENQAIVGSIGTIAGLILEGLVQRRFQISGLGRDVASQGTTAVTRVFSRDQEREADKLGLEWMNQGGYDPLGAVRVWQKMIEKQGDRGFSFFSTHPTSSERIQNLRQQIASLPMRRSVVATNTESKPVASAQVKSEAVIAESGSEGVTKPTPVGLLEKGVADYRNGDFQGALQSWTTVANQGDARGQFALATLYLRGQGVKKDATKAAELFKLAADQDYSVAQTNLAVLHMRGDGVPKDNAQALTLLEKASVRGNAEAMARLAAALFEGKRTDKNETRAIELARRAAEQNNVIGEYLLGAAYVSGSGVVRDYGEAAKWHEKAAKRGFAPSQVALGNMYRIGQGVQQDDANALRFYKLAADRDDANGQVALGTMYAAGRGVTKDYAEALRLFEEAHKSSNSNASYAIGTLHYDGLGVPKDIVKAYAWFSVSAELGNAAATKRKDTLETQLSEQQIEDSKSLAKQIKSSGAS